MIGSIITVNIISGRITQMIGAQRGSLLEENDQKGNC